MTGLTFWVKSKNGLAASFTVQLKPNVCSWVRAPVLDAPYRRCTARMSSIIGVSGATGVMVVVVMVPVGVVTVVLVTCV